MSLTRFARFDARSAAVLLSTAGAFPLPVLGFIAPQFLIDGGLRYLVIIWLFTALSFAITVYVGRLTDRQFAILGFGGMVGVAASAYLVTDPGASRAIVALLAAIPAIAAMGSSRRVTISFTLFAMTLAVALSTIEATSVIAVLVAGGAAVITVVVPVFMISALRATLGSALTIVATLGETDPLTGMLNRRGLLHHSGAVLAHITDTRCAVGFVMIDIDDFKSVNDTGGHAAGDSALIAVGAALATTVGGGAVLSRIGGEEFVVLCPCQTLDDVAGLAENLRDRVAAQCGVTISVGAICVPLIESTLGEPNIDDVIDSLTRRADECMYAAKDAGRNTTRARTGPPLVWVPGPPNEPHIEYVATEDRIGHLELIRHQRTTTAR